MDDRLISLNAALDAINANNGILYDNPTLVASLHKLLSELPPAQPDVVTASLEELINDYGEDGFFIVDGVNYRANELLNELKIKSSVGEKFRKQITKTIVQYFMKFGG